MKVHRTMEHQGFIQKRVWKRLRLFGDRIFAIGEALFEYGYPANDHDKYAADKSDKEQNFNHACC